MLVEMFHWNLHDIDETDMDSLLRFVSYYPHWHSARKEKPRAYSDQVDWL